MSVSEHQLPSVATRRRSVTYEQRELTVSPEYVVIFDRDRRETVGSRAGIDGECASRRHLPRSNRDQGRTL